MKQKNDNKITESKQPRESAKGSRFSERTKRRMRFGTNWFVLIAVVLAAFVLLNVALEQLPLSLDFTREKLYTLTEKTESDLDTLRNDIEIIALYDQVKGRSDSSRSMVMKVLDLYDRYDKVTVRYVDLTKNPTFVRDLVGEERVSDYSEGDYIVRCGNRVRRIASNSMFNITQVNLFYSAATGLMAEPMINAAIRYVQQDQVPVVYFSNGFGEKDLALYTTLQKRIENYGYDIAELDLSKEEIPDDAALLVFLGPTQDLSTVAAEKLNVYFQQGGGYGVFLMDRQVTGVSLENFNRVFSLFGMGINNDLIAEADPLTGEPFGFTARVLMNGPFADRAELNNPTTQVFETRSLRILNTTGNYTTIPLIYTSENATSMAAVGGEKTVGKSLVAAASEYTYTTSLQSSKIVLGGSSLAMQDSYITKWGYSGAGMFVYYMNWMYSSVLGSEEVETKTFDTSTVVTTTSQQKQLFVFSVVIFPLLILLTGGVIWFRRRHL